MKKIVNCFVKHNNRSILKIEGQDSFKFLQSITSQNIKLITPIEKSQNNLHSIYSVFLNSQGRILLDCFIYPRHQINKDIELCYFIECENKLIELLKKHILMFKLRSKINILDVSEQFHVWSAFGKDVLSLSNKSIEYTIDPRIPNIMGLRLLFPISKTPNFPNNFINLDSTFYHYYRIFHGIPEGSQDFPVEQALPHESVLEYLNALCYDKGCYIGQELTTRTHYTGIIRKMLIPIVIKEDFDHYSNYKKNDDSIFPSFFQGNSKKYQTIPISSYLVTKDGKKSGKVYNSIYNIGLAMIRFEHLTDPIVENNIFYLENTDIQLVPLKPFWWEQKLKDDKEKEEELKKLSI